MLKKWAFRVFSVAVLLLTACNIPQDPHDSWVKAKNNNLKVGIVASPSKEDSTIVKHERKLIEAFAAENNLQILYLEQSETDLVDQLKQYKIDVMLGAFDKNSIWKKEVGMTRPYDKEHVIFIPKGENKLVFQLENFLNQQE